MVDTSKYAASFELVDGDGDGLISAGELQRMMQGLGTEVTDAQAAEMVRKVDGDGDGRITLEEFAAFMARGGA
jgi:Ca2+-binding EF-hand superfamily protein